jgi:hypothetical protein
VDRLFEITSPIEKILLSYRFDIPQWLPLAYASLCERNEPLSIEEGRRLFELGGIGGDIIVLLNQARHELNSTSPQLSSFGSFSKSASVTRVSGVVKKVFGLDQGVSAATSRGL